MNEQLKSVEKTAEAARDIVARVGDFFDKYLGRPAGEVGEIVTDWIKYFRYKNLLSIYDKVEDLHRQRQIAGKPIPISPRIAIPLLEAASAEDNVSLQELWARLIANSTDPNIQTTIHPAYIEVIKQLTPDEAVIIEALSKIKNYPTVFHNRLNIDSRYPSHYNNLYFESIYKEYEKFCKALSLSKPDSATAYLDNLLRLRIVDFSYQIEQKLKNNELTHLQDMMEEVYINENREEYLSITDFGDNFIKSCIRSNTVTSS